MFNLTVKCYKPDTTWLDEVAEALKNITAALNDTICYLEDEMPEQVRNYASEVPES